MFFVGVAFLFSFSAFLTASAQEVLLPLESGQWPSGSRWTAPAGKTQAALALPFFDDFATGTVSGARWQAQGGASVSVDVSPLAPTVGMATLDAFDGDGMLYANATTGIFPADTLTSLPLQLAGMTAADSVALSFYYLPGGGYGNMWERVGECPDAQDSLFVDFFRAADSSWVTVWSRGGISVDTLMARTGRAWQYVMLPLREAWCFDSAFAFRFRSYASLESSPKAGRIGNCDYWHLDYVQLDRGRDTLSASESRDVAFAAPAQTLLRQYRAMPFRQYQPQEMASSLEMKIVNLYSSALASHYGYAIYDTAGNEVYAYDGGFDNAPAYEPNGTYQTAPMHASPAVAYTFPAMTEPTEYTVEHVVREGTGGDAFPHNDTVRYRQVFGTYFAYDDGTAENGYGITSTASQLYLAYRFDLNSEDTLTAVDIWFNRTLNGANESIPFYLTLWSLTEEGMPGEVLYRDENRRYAQTGGFARYVLEEEVVVDGTVFVGFEQTGNEYLNLGYDGSLNTSERIYYLTGTEWQQSILSGSLMLRPCFGSAATVSVEEVASADNRLIYPNPASDRVWVEGFPIGSRIELYDTFGRTVLRSQLTTLRTPLTTSGLPNGLYLLRVVAPDGAERTTKLIVKH